MNKNPFASGKFPSIWLEHFRPDRIAVLPDFISELSFVQSRFIPLYTNVGRTHTKGVDYALSNKKAIDYKKRVFLIYDVPSYFDIDTEHSHQQLKLYKINQYPGFLISLKCFKDLNDYLLAAHSKNSRSKLKKFKRRLENCFDIDYKMFFEDISRDDYDFIFENFKLLLEKRFSDKQITNNNLDPKEWEFYKTVAYPMILEKKAALFVVYDGIKPIGITLNYISDKVLFDAITVFDIDYSKFHLGSVMLMKLIEYSIVEEFEMFDFSKGDFDYKRRWANKIYDFEYHIYYDTRSFTSKIIALALKTYFSAKQFLRTKKINDKFYTLIFWLNNGSGKTNKKAKYTITKLENHCNGKAIKEIDADQILENELKHIVFEFLYLNNEHYQDLKIYKVMGEESGYLLYGKNISVEVAFKKKSTTSKKTRFAV